MILQWFDFFALIIKIIVLSTVYATLLIVACIYIYRKTGNNWLKKRLNYKLRNWLFLHLLISVCLFYYSFTYWQDTGLGENPSLPIGYGQRIYSPDFEWTDFYPDLDKTELNKDELQIENFIVQDSVLCAKISHQNSNSPNYDFIVCNLQSRTNKTFLTEADYNKFAIENKLPLKDNFLDFKTHYRNYFDKKPEWKKWLLP